jgi:hypothetical protein
VVLVDLITVWLRISTHNARDTKLVDARKLGFVRKIDTAATHQVNANK